MNIIGGNAADVLQVNWNWIESYSQGGKNFADLHQYEDVLDLTQFPEDSLAQCEVDGKLMAVIAGYLGLDSGLEAIFFGMAVGAIWSLCRLWHGKSLKTYFIYLAACFTQEFQTRGINECGEGVIKSPMGTIPLAPCMAAGTYLYLMVTGAMMIWKGGL